MRPDQDPFFLQRGQRDCACCHERGCDTAAEMPAAAVVLVPVVLAVRRVIRVARAREEAGRRIVLAPRVLVRDQNTDRRPCRVPLKDSAHDPEPVGLHPPGGDRAGRPALSEFSAMNFFVYRDSRAQARPGPPRSLRRGSRRTALWQRCCQMCFLPYQPPSQISPPAARASRLLRSHRRAHPCFPGPTTL